MTICAAGDHRLVMLRVLSTYEFIPQGHTVSKEMNAEILPCLKDAVRRKLWKNGYKTAGFFHTTMYLHISPWGSKSTLPSTTLQLCSIRHIP
jgi:hypothetical protein